MEKEKLLDLIGTISMAVTSIALLSLLQQLKNRIDKLQDKIREMEYREYWRK